MNARGVDSADLTQALKIANEERCNPPLEEQEVKAIAASISRYSAPPSARRFKWTDLGNAERLVARHGRDLRYIQGNGWFVWDSTRWRRDTTGEPMRRMKETIRAIYAEAKELDDPDALLKFARRSEGESRLRAALTLAQTEWAVVASTEELDANPWLLNVGNGTVDLTTGELRPHERTDLISKLTATDYVRDSTSQTWADFLRRITDDDSDLQAFLQRAVGYSLTGRNDEEVLFFAHGPAATGKSTFLEAVKAILGDYAATSDFETFLKKKGDAGVRSDIARLAGARFVVGAEVDRGKELAEGLVKLITGGDKISARFLYQEFFEFVPQFKLWLAANDRPRVSATDEGMWRRILQVPFANRIPPAEQKKDLKALFREDSEVRSAILAWAVEGCLKWQSQGLAVPDRVTAYTEEYRVENDPLHEFFEEVCIFEPVASVTRPQLREAQREWAIANGEQQVAAKMLSKAVQERGAKDGSKSKGKRTWTGVGVREGEASQDEGIAGETPF
jgi:putative DNA primase/helicase